MLGQAVLAFLLSFFLFYSAYEPIISAKFEILNQTSWICHSPRWPSSVEARLFQNHSVPAFRWTEKQTNLTWWCHSPFLDYDNTYTIKRYVTQRAPVLVDPYSNYSTWS